MVLPSRLDKLRAMSLAPEEMGARSRRKHRCIVATADLRNATASRQPPGASGGYAGVSSPIARADPQSKTPPFNTNVAFLHSAKTRKTHSASGKTRTYPRPSGYENLGAPSRLRSLPCATRACCSCRAFHGHILRHFTGTVNEHCMREYPGGRTPECCRHPNSWQTTTHFREAI